MATPSLIRRRRSPDFDHVRYTRRVKGKRLQVRFAIPGCGEANAGSYDRATAIVVRRKMLHELQHHPFSVLGVWRAARAVLDQLRAAGMTTPDLLPKFVRKAPGGGFLARTYRQGRRIVCPGPFADPEQAHLAMVALLAVEFPRPVATGT